MAVLKAATRNKLPASKFGLPGSRKYPMPDKVHAAQAKARATQQVAKGNLSASSASKIKAKANRILGKPKNSLGKMMNGDEDLDGKAYRPFPCRMRPGRFRWRGTRTTEDQFWRVVRYACHCFSRPAIAASCLLALSSRLSATVSSDLTDSCSSRRLCVACASAWLISAMDTPCLVTISVSSFVVNEVS